jgi:aldehyde dehydrogenase (NAD+)
VNENAGYERGTVLVDGRWTPTATRTEVFNPATAAVIGTAASSTAADVDRAATAARTAGTRWARSAHVDLALDVLVSFAELAERWDDERIGNSLVIRQAAGVVAAITPRNYPLYQPMAKVAPALAAGCGVIVKPAELTPLSAYLVADAIIDAEFPPGVVNLLSGSGSAVGGALWGPPW